MFLILSKYKESWISTTSCFLLLKLTLTSFPLIILWILFSIPFTHTRPTGQSLLTLASSEHSQCSIFSSLQTSLSFSEVQLTLSQLLAVVSVCFPIPLKHAFPNLFIVFSAFIDIHLLLCFERRLFNTHCHIGDCICRENSNLLFSVTRIFLILNNQRLKDIFSLLLRAFGFWYHFLKV